MSDTSPAKRSVFRRILLATFVTGLLLMAALVAYVHTSSFRNMVHQRLVSALERITGGRVALGRFAVVPFRFRVEVYDLTIHGREAPTEIPYAHADHLVAEIKIISIFEKEFGFHSILLERPVLHIITYPDGSTNQPQPKVRRDSSSTVEQLFSLFISRVRISDGALLWNDQRIPLDFSASNFTSQMNYSILRRRYDGQVQIGRLESVLPSANRFSSGLRTQFSLGEAYLDVQRLELSSALSHVEASGRVDRFDAPRFSGSYTAGIDLGEVGSIFRIGQLRSGALQLQGKGSISADDFLLRGEAAVHNLEWRESTLNLKAFSINTSYDASRSRLRLSRGKLTLLGGAATAEAEIVNWLDSSAAKYKKKAAEEQRGSIVVKFRDISTTELASALTTRRLPLNQLKFAGFTAGQMIAKWRGSYRNLEASFTFEVVPPPALAPGRIPLTAKATGVYRGMGEELELSSLEASTPSTQIRAAGRLSAVSSVKFSVGTNSLDEWQPLLNNWRGAQIPITLRGRAVFNGTASGRLSNFALSGHLRLNDFDSLVARTGDGRPMHWDSLVADVQASPQAISARRGLLLGGKTAIAFDLAAVLHNGEFVDTSPFTARINVQNANAKDLQSLLGYNYPISGELDLLLNGSGTRLRPHAEGQVDLRNGLIFEQPISRLHSGLRYNSDEFQFNNALLLYKDGQISGSLAYNPTLRNFHFNVSGNRFQLAHFSPLQKSPVSIEGDVDFTAQGSGNLDSPAINATFHLRNLIFDKERAGDFDLTAVTRGEDLQLTGQSRFEKAQLSIGGNIRLRDQWPTDLVLKFDQLDVDPLLHTYVPKSVTGHSLVAGNVHLVGPLRRLRELSATGDLTELSLSVEKIVLQNEGPVHFTVKDEILSLERMRLLGEGTDVTAHGSARLAGNQELSLRADGRLNFRLMENFSPDLTASGVMNVAVNVGGTFHKPSLLGQVQISNAAISSVDLPNGFSNMNGTLVFNQDRLDIQSMTAQVGGGNVDLTGYVAYTPQLNFDIAAQGRDVRLRPAGISATANAELRLAGSASDALLSGDVTIVKLNLAQGFDFARYLESSKQSASLPQSQTILNNVRIDIHVVTTPELQMQSSLAKLSGEADLRLRGTIVRPVVLGRVDIMEGQVYFSGTKYRLERGEVTFAGPTGVKPILDLQASTHVRDYDITLGINGTPEKLNFTYRSEPPLPSADIIALLALGRTQSESASLSTSSQTAFSQEASNVILNQALNATLNNRAQRLFGISSIKVDPQGLNTETTPTRSAPAVTIEQQISNDFTLTYSTEVSQSSQQVIQGEYNITRSISILGIRDQNGVVSFDIRLRQRRK